MQAGFIDDLTFFGMNSTGNFLDVFRYDIENASLDNDPLWSVRNTKNKFFTPLDNFLLKQDIYFEQDEQSLYMGFKYSSLLIKVNKKGLVYFTLEPTKDLLPNEKPENERIYSLPDIGTYPICVLDIDVQGEYLYMLYSGESLSSSSFFSRLFSPDEEIARIKHSDRIFRYDKNSGEFIDELKIPLQANSIEITKKYIYVMSFISAEVPTIYKYSIDALTDKKSNN